MGIKAMRVIDQEELPEKIKEFLEYDGPILMEAVVTKGEHVLPMVPAGKALHQFLVHGKPLFSPSSADDCRIHQAGLERGMYF